MMFNSEQWRNKIANLIQQIDQRFTRQRQQTLPYFTYGMVGGLTLWPLVEAIRQAIASGQSLPIAVYMSLGSIAGGIGGNLIAEQLQRWTDRAEQLTQEEVSAWVAETAPTNPELREALDKLIAEFKVIQQTEKQLTPTDRDWFIEMLQAELQKLPPTSQTTLTVRDGAIAYGNDNIVVAKQGSYVGRDANAPIFTGNHNFIHLTNIYITAFSGKAVLDKVEFAKTLHGYLEWVVNKYGQLQLRGLEDKSQSSVGSKALDAVYISLSADLAPPPDSPRLRRQLEEPTKQEGLVDMRTLLPSSPRLAIIGGAGSGKTTYLRFIATLLAQALLDGKRERVVTELGLSNDLPLPILLTLSEYNQYRRSCEGQIDANAGTLVTFLSHTLIKQESALGLPADFFQRLLHEGKGCLLLLDGADEVADERERRIVIEQVENLAHNKGVGQIIVTSRTRALRGETGLPHFRLATIRPMNEQQVTALAKRWCEAVYGAQAGGREAKALLAQIAELEALRERQGQPRLLDSPMLVTIVAIVHYNQTRLPDQRAALYDQCVRILIREAHKPARVQPELAERGGRWEEKREWLGQIAWQMMSQGQEAGRVVEERTLQRWLVQMLCERGYEKEAQDKSQRFIELLRERESVIEEQSRQYRFIHLTFQEFLAAFHLAETVRDWERMRTQLQEQDAFRQSWWRETILLTCGFLAMSGAGNAEQFIRTIGLHDGQDENALARAELAGAGLLEIGSDNPKLRREIAERLVILIEDPMVKETPVLRLLAGDTLARLGDPRPGVGVRADGLPDLVWGTLIPAGNYTIGDENPIGSDGKLRPAIISAPYQLARYPITNAQFDCFVQAKDVSDSRWWEGIPQEEKRFHDPVWPIANRPRESVSWYQAVAFCRWLSHHRRETISLPHEYQWEVAARYAGNGRCDKRAYPWGDEPITSEHANYRDINLYQTSAVGLFPCGRQSHSGLDDLSGNLYEWCANKYFEPDVAHFGQNFGDRALRGGSWLHVSSLCLVAYRHQHYSNIRNNFYGFRVVRVLTPR